MSALYGGWEFRVRGQSKPGPERMVASIHFDKLASTLAALRPWFET